MDFADWLTLVRTSWRSLTAATLIGALLGAGALLLQDRTWTSAGTVLLTPAVRGADGQDQAFAGQYVLSRMKSYGRLAASSRVRAAATEELSGDNTSIGEVHADWEPETTLVMIQVTSDSARDARADARLVLAAFEEALARVEPNAQITVSTAVIAEPDLPAESSSPRPAVNLVGGAVLGLLAGLAVALFRRLRQPREA